MSAQESQKVGQIEVSLKKSLIGCNPNQRACARALGLKRIGNSMVHPNIPSVRGAIKKVIHLLNIREF